jgi:hypothetical protein
MTQVNSNDDKRVKFPDQRELRAHLKRGDIVVIAHATHKSPDLIHRVFTGERKLKPDVRRAYDIVVRMNRELDQALAGLGEDKKRNATK